MKLILYNKFKKLVLRPLHKKMSHKLSCRLENAIAFIRGKNIKFIYDGGMFACEDGLKQKISNKLRGFKLYRNGITFREKELFDSYCLGKINFDKNDIVFDCGANSGDLFLRLNRLIVAQNYYAFEPNPEDYKVLDYNVKNRGGRTYNLALGDSDSQLVFFTATSKGDSSIIEPISWDEKTIVNVVRLDTFLAESNINKVKLLKLEAEGYEPEILSGIGNMLCVFEYIAIDGGFERGKNKDETFTTCTNYLLSNGFEVIDIYFKSHRALYRRCCVTDA